MWSRCQWLSLKELWPLLVALSQPAYVLLAQWSQSGISSDQGLPCHGAHYIQSSPIIIIFHACAPLTTPYPSNCRPPPRPAFKFIFLLASWLSLLRRTSSSQHNVSVAQGDYNLAVTQPADCLVLVWVVAVLLPSLRWDTRAARPVIDLVLVSLHVTSPQCCSQLVYVLPQAYCVIISAS